eukprot:TRINITY_DN1755_c0_g1_i1.p1 TRINITY_DN1755_c0_g1~~TRINITY_DN1755_c0_g1_i1.p1  ORF type:complete len:474 (+),score=133.42 TRINITY_DN1755_c0_g1_i1:182-1603(+)
MASTVDAARVAEHHEQGEVLSSKLDKLVELMKRSRYTVFYTGAGVSTSAGVGDYRGPSGAWTERRIAQLRGDTTEAGKRELAQLLAEKQREQKKSSGQVNMLDALPAYNHMAVAKLMQKDLAHYVITTNLDGIYRKAGFQAHTQVCFLHGDVYTERCTACGYEFERNYEVRRANIHVHDHFVGVCDKCGSGAPEGYTGRPAPGAETGSGVPFTESRLVGTRDKNCGTKDTHINFGEVLDSIDWKEADEHCKKADLCVVMGTSMSLRHITHFPFLAKQTVIINLQATPDDAKCDLRVWTTCDTAMQGVMRRLGLDIDDMPVWRPKDALSIAELKRRGVRRQYVEAAERLEAFTRSQERFMESNESDREPPAPSAPPLPTRVTLHNNVSQRGEDGLIPWTVSLQDPSSAVDSVVFKLHPTFTPNTVTVNTPPFAVSRRGWGEFAIEITLYLRAGGVRTIRHELCLSSSDVRTIDL